MNDKQETTYPVHTAESAPEMAREGLLALRSAIGIIPNLAATMAESPALLRGFLTLRELYATTDFSPGEVQVLSLTAAYENDCAWCVAFHSAMAIKEGVGRDVVESLRRGAPPEERRLAALSNFARSMLRNRGNVDAEARHALFDAGYSKQQALDVVMGMAFSVMANYASHLTHPPLDAFLESFAWQR